MSTPGDAPGRPGPRRSPVRVLWLIKGLGPGGAERLLVQSARRRDREGVLPRVAFLRPDKTALVGQLAAEDVDATCLGARRWLDPRWLWRLRRELVSHPVDVVHVHSPVPALGARAVLRTLRRRRRPALVTTLHSTWDHLAGPVRVVERLTAGLDDARTVVSGAVRASLPPRMRPLVEVVRSGVDLEAIGALATARDEVRAELGLGRAGVVGTVANLRPVKAYPVLLDAATRVVEAVPAARFVTVGQGPQAAEITRRRDELGLGDAFLLLGHREDAVRVMSACDVFCLPSLREGLPVALMEAVALGLPVVGSDVAGIREVVTDGVEGILVPPGRPDALATALVALLTDHNRRETMAAAARARGQALSAAASVARIEAIYAEVARR